MFSNTKALQSEIEDELLEKVERNLKAISAFVKKMNDNEDNKNLTLWLKWFCDIRLALLYSGIINEKKADEKETKKYLDSSERALDDLKNLGYDDSYIDLFYGYLHLNKFQHLQKLDKNKERNAQKEHIEKSINYFEKFFNNYTNSTKSVALIDTYLSDYFEMELNYSRNEFILLENNDSTPECEKYRVTVAAFIKKDNEKPKHGKMEGLKSKFRGLMSGESQ